MSHGRAAILLLASALLLAGCSGSRTAGDAGPAADAGVLRGLVVDDAVRPLAGVSVAARGQGGEWNATTGADGLFRIAGLPPGAYLVSASKLYHIGSEQAVDVRADAGPGGEPPLVRFQLAFEARSVPFAALYKYEGFHECGFNVMRICSNVNILTSIVLCQYPGAPCVGNVTADRSLFFQAIDGIPAFIQAELAWTPTTEPGQALNFYIGGGNVTELQLGTASTYNGTGGLSPLMLRITNHEGDDAWCHRVPDPPCPVPDTLNQSRIGAERTLLAQVDAGETYPAPYPGCEDVGYCGAGFSTQQPFTMFTTVFYGYEPPDEWRFVDTGATPPPPPPPA
jgi:hypothetical protein